MKFVENAQNQKKKIADKKAYDLKMAVEAERIEQEKQRLAAEKAEKLKGLKAIKKKECVDYQLMSGKEMLEKKASCKE